LKSFAEISQELPNQLEKLINAPSYRIENLTEGTIKKIFGENLPIEGVFVISNYTENKFVYVGRSRNLATRIGIDLRAITREQATLSYKLTTLKEKYPDISTIRDGRDYMYEHFSVQMLKVANENERAILQIFAAMELNTINVFNSFKES